MVREPLNNSPNLFLRTPDQTCTIYKAVNSLFCKIIFDIYHRQKNEGRIRYNLNHCWSKIAYIQVGDEPGRKEPGTGEINYHNIFKPIYDKKYKGVIGMEHGNAQPDTKGEQAVINGYVRANKF